MKKLFIFIAILLTQYQAVNSQVKYNPGHYGSLGNSFTQADLADLLKTPGLKGVQLRYTWLSLETAEGVYNFNKIASDLKVVSAAGKRLIVFFEEKSFKEGVKYTPQYLWALYTAPSGTNPVGTISKRWDNYVVDRVSLLMDTLAKKFDNEPAFEGVAFQESATGLSSVNITAYEYTPDKYRDALIKMLTNAKKSFKNSQVFWFMNYLAQGQSYIANIANAIAPYGVLMGGPDILPDSPDLKNRVYPFYSQFKGRLHLFCAAQFDSYHHEHTGYGYATKYWTMEEIYLWGKNNLYIDYCFWNVPKYVDSDFPGSYTWTQAKPVILKYASLTTSLQSLINEEEFKVYPNPGDGLLNISSTSSNPIHTISIFDPTGKEMYKQLFSTSVAQIDVRHLKSDIYLLKVNETVIKWIKL